ncbi:MAG: 23S rRNA (guanosine(2251)-2'-O)-methyltransferase RlmB [Desulfobacteraceae bacterium]
MSRNKQKTEVLFGRHSVFEALKAGKRTIYEVMISKERSRSRLEEIIAMAGKKKVPVVFKPAVDLDRITDSARHQGIAARVSVFSAMNSETVFNKVQQRQASQFILVIENLEDPHNFGALIRTALGAGVDFILMPKDRAAAPLPSVSRASAGAMEHADIALMTNTVSVLQRFKKMGFWVAGLDGEGDTLLFKADLTGDLILVVGGEHRGIRPLVKSQCDFLLSLPQKKGVASLNASVAGGIAMYEALRQRTFG